MLLLSNGLNTGGWEEKIGRIGSEYAAENNKIHPTLEIFNTMLHKIMKLFIGVKGK